MTENIFAGPSAVLSVLKPEEWARLWRRAEMADMVIAVRVLDDDVAEAALMAMPEGLAEPEIPERTSVEEAIAAVGRLCALAEDIIIGPAGAASEPEA